MKNVVNNNILFEDKLTNILFNEYLIVLNKHKKFYEFIKLNLNFKIIWQIISKIILKIKTILVENVKSNEVKAIIDLSISSMQIMF